MVLYWRRYGRAGGCQIIKKTRRKPFEIERAPKERSNLHQQGSAVKIAGFTSDQSVQEAEDSDG